MNCSMMKKVFKDLTTKESKRGLRVLGAPKFTYVEVSDYGTAKYFRIVPT